MKTHLSGHVSILLFWSKSSSMLHSSINEVVALLVSFEPIRDNNDWKRILELYLSAILRPRESARMELGIEGIAKNLSQN